MSILLNRIAEVLARETDPAKRAEAATVRAAYLARIGRFGESKQEIAEVRQVFGDGRSARVTILLMVAEALLQHFERLENGAFDRILRAELLANATRDRSLAALASAWKAHLALEASDFPIVGRSLKAAIENAAPADHAALSRCALVLQNVALLCGQLQRAQHWFMEGRRHALEEGDQATIEALQHNRASFSAARLAADWCQNRADAQLLERTKREVQSSRNLQVLTQIAALKHYIDLCESRLLIIEGNWKLAKEALDQMRSVGPFPATHFNQELVALETVYCDAHLNAGTAANTAALPHFSSFDSLDPDDQLWAAKLRSDLARLGLGDQQECEETLAVSVTKYEEWVQGLWATVIENGVQ